MQRTLAIWAIIRHRPIPGYLRCELAHLLAARRKLCWVASLQHRDGQDHWDDPKGGVDFLKNRRRFGWARPFSYSHSTSPLKIELPLPSPTWSSSWCSPLRGFSCIYVVKHSLPLKKMARSWSGERTERRRFWQGQVRADWRCRARRRELLGFCYTERRRLCCDVGQRTLWRQLRFREVRVVRWCSPCRRQRLCFCGRQRRRLYRHGESRRWMR